ncbi:10431_t:CDS:2 [Ambispora leptoticha]|uniref:10431_t:CDS:1 n=1 Tax=Ambispora leptoticha TaxID=144679 RepID=A0A9N9A854_9GLOM|nr:10431_t:CDS:2 [Ambispora leptoticha]
MVTNTTPTTTYANLNAPLTWPQTQPYNGVKDQAFYTVFTFIYTFFVLSSIGSSYVIYRTYVKWKNNKFESLPMSLRLPFYTVTTDFFITSTFAINTSYGAAYAVPWFSPVCEMVGALSVWTQCLNVFLFLVVSMSTYLRVCRQMRINYGKYDYKLFLTVFVMATLPLLPASINNGYGPQKWWCAGASQTRLVGILALVIQLSIFVLTGFAYLRILMLLAYQSQQVHEESDPSLSKLEYRVTRNIARYILLFLLQWIPVFVSVIAYIFEIEDTWMYMIEPVGGFGGIGNAILYIINEGFSHKSNNDSSDISKSLKVESYSDPKHILSNDSIFIDLFLTENKYSTATVT